MEKERLNEEELDLMQKSIELMDEDEFNAVFKKEISAEEAKNSTLDVFPDPNIPLSLQNKWINEGLQDSDFSG